MRKLWNWFRGTNKVWIEMKVVGKVKLIHRRVHVHPFAGIYAWRYDEIGHGMIRLFANGKGTCDTRYTEILRWIPASHRSLHAKYKIALAIGEIDRKWEGDK